MKVQEIRFRDLEDFRNNLPGEPGDKWIFRGEEYTENPNDALKTTLHKSFEQFGLEDAQEKRKAEIDVIREFQRKLHLYMGNLPTRADINQWLAIMEHHGAPTRLLDWTYSFWIAVHFATTRRKPDDLASLWAVNTKNILNGQKELDVKIEKEWEERPKPENLPYGDIDAVKDNALIHYLLQRDKAEPGVYAVTGFRLNQRITIQQGTFLVSGDITKSFYENLSKTLNKNDIKKIEFKVTTTLKQDITKHLSQMNINNAVLFPGLEGFSESLWTRVGIPTKDKLSIEEKLLSLWP